MSGHMSSEVEPSHETVKLGFVCEVCLKAEVESFNFPCIFMIA